MSESVFAVEGATFIPTEHARGPWSPTSLHGGAPAALFATAFERMEQGSDLRIGRLGVEFLRPLNYAPMELSTWIARPGRRVQELAGELRVDGELICRASALRVRAVPDGLPRVGGAEERGAAPLPPPSQAEPSSFTLNGAEEASFGASAMEMRWFGNPWTLGPGRVWMRMRVPLVADRPASPLARLAAVADFGNGVSAALPFDSYLFINADLTIHLAREPRGEWIGLDSHTQLYADGAGLAESVLHDEHGPVGRAFQTLVVQPR